MLSALLGLTWSLNTHFTINQAAAANRRFLKFRRRTSLDTWPDNKKSACENKNWRLFSALWSTWAIFVCNTYNYATHHWNNLQVLNCNAWRTFWTSFWGYLNQGEAKEWKDFESFQSMSCEWAEYMKQNWAAKDGTNEFALSSNSWICQGDLWLLLRVWQNNIEQAKYFLSKAKCSGAAMDCRKLQHTTSACSPVLMAPFQKFRWAIHVYGLQSIRTRTNHKASKSCIKGQIGSVGTIVFWSIHLLFGSWVVRMWRRVAATTALDRSNSANAACCSVGWWSTRSLISSPSP